MTTVFDEVKLLNKKLKETSKVIEKLNKRIEELTIQLSDAQCSCRTKDRIIAGMEVEIDDIKKRLRESAFMGGSASEET